jgi:hypothetical protein
LASDKQNGIAELSGNTEKGKSRQPKNIGLPGPSWPPSGFFT